jgi:rod shape-determining protein MreC
VSDSAFNQHYIYTSGEVINNSTNRQKNFFTVNKGAKQGVSVDMAVITGNSVAGIIVGCSENYSLAMSLLNLDFKLSARIKSKRIFRIIKLGRQELQESYTERNTSACSHIGW